MTVVTPADLSPWLESDALLQSLGKIEEGQLTELGTAVRQLLQHDDPDVVQEALRWTVLRWRMIDLHDDVLNLIRTTEDEELKTTALYALAHTSSATTRLDDTRTLLTVVRASEVDPEVRRAAYEAILLMYGRTDIPPVNRSFNVDLQADWAWLSSISNGN